MYCSYLTPPGTQGFAPHWDEIDAFILQLEGKKHWKVYEPIDDDEILPRESSGGLLYRSRHCRTIGNLTAAEMHGRQIAWEGCVNAGDLLYVPRGFIHQVRSALFCHACFTINLCRRTQTRHLTRCTSRFLHVGRTATPTCWRRFCPKFCKVVFRQIRRFVDHFRADSSIIWALLTIRYVVTVMSFA